MAGLSMMSNYGGEGLYCHRERKACVKWVEKYLKDCLCNLSDELSFGFGIISLVAWGVAEIPQIVTNFRSKSGHGVSILFLLTWFIGDIFNLAGCVLEPATLPTQLYTALLYTVSTVVLVLQSIYYDYYCWWRRKRRQNSVAVLENEDGRMSGPRKLNSENGGGGGGLGGDQGGGRSGGGIPIPSRRGTVTREYYYTSARSLAGSDTPPFRSSSNSYLRKARSGPSATTVGGGGGLGGLYIHEHDDKQQDYSSSEEDNNRTTTHTQPRPIPRAVSRGAAALVVAATVNLPIVKTDAAALRLTVGRRLLLQEREFEHSGVGQWLGWLMTAVYMGGRIPQIVLNIKRGSVEGLNPLMFIFALVANVAYVASILVRSTEWAKIKANMPWLLDALGCVALDLFIILQYVYYKYCLLHKNIDDGIDHLKEDDGKINEPLLPPQK